MYLGGMGQEGPNQYLVTLDMATEDLEGIMMTRLLNQQQGFADGGGRGKLSGLAHTYYFTNITY
jgi:hypothetical protein